MTAEILTLLAVTLELAAVSTVVLLLLATPLAWWLARTRAPWREAAAALTLLPLVLPPTVMGFYLLLSMAPKSPLMAVLGPILGRTTLNFSFEGLVIGSLVYSLPFAVQPLRLAFERLPQEVLEVAAGLGARPFSVFLRIALPLAWSGFLTAGLLVFAHTVGEFGIVMMIGGSIPGETRVVSIGLYELVESGRNDTAHALSAGLAGFSFVVLLVLLRLGRRRD